FGRQYFFHAFWKEPSVSGGHCQILVKKKPNGRKSHRWAMDKNVLLLLRFAGPQILEVVAVGIHQQNVALAGETLLIGIYAACKGIEFLILGVGCRISRSCLRVPFTTDALSIPIGLNQQYGFLTIGVGLDTDGQLVTT